jgi:hypothetical protein
MLYRGDEDDARETIVLCCICACACLCLCVFVYVFFFQGTIRHVVSVECDLYVLWTYIWYTLLYRMYVYCTVMWPAIHTNVCMCVYMYVCVFFLCV